MLRTFIQVTAMCLALMSSFFLLKGGLGISAEQILRLSTAPYGEYNEEVAQSLTEQKSDTFVGFALLLGSFVLSLVNMLMPMYCDEFAVNRRGLIAAMVVSALAFIAAYVTAEYLQCKWYREVQRIQGNILETGIVPRSNLSSLRERSKSREKNETGQGENE